MMFKILISNICRQENRRIFLQYRYGVPGTSFVSKYSVNSVKYKAKDTHEDEDDFDKPFKFSTSKAATFPAAYTTAEALGVPWYQGIVIALSLTVFLVYFVFIREENDIDEEMVKNIPPEILEQIYGKPKTKK